MSRKPSTSTFGHTRLVRTFTWCILIAKCVKFVHTDNENSDQIARIHMLNCLVFGVHRPEGTFSDVATHIVVEVI